MTAVIKYNPRLKRWAVWINGFPTAFARNAEVLQRHFPDATVEEYDPA